METVATGESKLSPSAAGRKMKQTRLPFQVLSGSPTAAPAPSPRTPSESRKRKPSLESVVAVDALRAAKIGRTSEAKENVKAEGGPVSSVVVIDDDSVPGPPVDVDEGSNSRDLVDVRKDGKLVKVGKDEEEDAGVSDKKIRIKLPMAGKKRKSVGGSEKKDKKDKKEKKKHKKGGKEGKVKGLAEGGEPIAIDDSDLSDEEKVDEAVPESKADKEVVEKDEEPTVEKPEETSEELKESSETKDKEEIVEKVEEPTAEKETKTDDKLEEPSEMPKPEVTPRRARGRPSKVQKEDDKKKSPKSRRSVRVAKQEEDEKPVEEPTKEVEKPSEETSEIEKPEEVKEETKASEVESSDDAKEEPSKEPEEASAKKRTRASLASSKKKSEDQEAEPKKESPEDKKPSAKGALDKFFAKVQNGTTPEKPKVVVSKPTEDAEEEDEDEEAEPMEVGESRNNTIASICLDDSDDGENTADAEENAYMLCTPNSKDRAAGSSGALDITKLTPKQMARRVEAEKKLAAKQQELEDRKRKKIEEREAKLKEKEEQERMRKKEKEDKEEAKRKEKEEKEEAKRKEREEKEEAKRKEKEEKDEQKRKEREEKEKKRQAELDAKSEEKRKKDEQKEEERRKKEEEKEAEEKRKQKTAQAFQSFFVVKKGNGSGGGSKLSDDENSMDQSSEAGGDGSQPPQQTQAFMPFCVKGDMRLAPTCRVTLTKDRKRTLEEVLRKSGDEQGKDAVVEEDRSELWLEQIKSDKYRVGSMDRTWIAQEEDAGADDDVMIVDDDVCHQIEEDRTAVPSRRYRAKYFLFEENRRPPFRGTWRKQSAKIRPRRPLALDTKFFDYEVDSDDEWEEEEPGESLHGSDDEKDVDKEEEDYEVDNDFFVPHGHLSDEELQAEDDVADDNSPEAQKAKLKIMQQEFAAEMKKKTEKIKPRLIGCLWENGGSGNGERSECSAVIWEILKARAMLFDPEEPLSFTTARSEPDSNQSSPSKPGESNDRATERVPKAKMVKLVDEGVRELIKLIHGCAQNRSFLVKEFLAYWGKRRDEGEIVPQFAPDSIRTKILEISSWRPCPEEGPMQNKMCWYVNKEALVRFEMADLKVPTGWDFILKPIVKSKAKEKKEKEKETNGEEGGEGEKKTPPRKKKDEANGEEKEKKDRQSSTPSSSSKIKPAAAAITKFTKKLSEDEKRKQFAKEKKKSIPSKSAEEPATKPKTPKSTGKKTSAAAASSSSTDSAAQQPKKRVQLLMSVPRGQSIPQATKNNLISQFLAKPKAATSSNTDQPERMDVDEVVVLDD